MSIEDDLEQEAATWSAALKSADAEGRHEDAETARGRLVQLQERIERIGANELRRVERETKRQEALAELGRELEELKPRVMQAVALSRFLIGAASNGHDPAPPPGWSNG